MDICQLLEDELRKPRAIMMKAMAQRTELRIRTFSDLGREAAQNTLVALQAWQACFFAPFARMPTSMKLINDEVKFR